MQYITNTNALLRGLSTPRLSRYIELAPNNTIRQLELYQWNTALSESLYTPIQGLEITCRNFFHESLVNFYGESWFDNGKVKLAVPQWQRPINPFIKSL